MTFATIVFGLTGLESFALAGVITWLVHVFSSGRKKAAGSGSSSGRDHSPPSIEPDYVEADVDAYFEDHDDGIDFGLDVESPRSLDRRKSRRSDLGLPEDDEAEYLSVMAEADELIARAEAARALREQTKQLNGPVRYRFRIGHDGEILEENG